MRTIATTLGTAAIVGFAGLGLAATATAAQLQAPVSTGTLTAVEIPLSRDGGNGADRRSDQHRADLERARINGYAGADLPVMNFGQHPAN
jgi:hypothetical protein